MLDKSAIERLKEGQSVFYPFSRRGVATGEVLQVVPIKSRRTGQIVRYVVHSRNPDREKGDGGKS